MSANADTSSAHAYDPITMIKRKVLALALMGCGDGGGVDDPHATSTCDDTTITEGRICEFACDTDVELEPVSCAATVVFDDAAPTGITCDDTFGFSGKRGCCVLDTAAAIDEVAVYFAECE